VAFRNIIIYIQFVLFVMQNSIEKYFFVQVLLSYNYFRAVIKRLHLLSISLSRIFPRKYFIIQRSIYTYVVQRVELARDFRSDARIKH